MINWPGPKQGTYPLLWKRSQWIKKNTSLRFSMGLALKLSQLVEHRNEAFSAGRRGRMETKAGFWSGAVWCPAQRSGRDHLLEEANTPLALDPWGIFPLICESHQGCQESKDSFLSHRCLNRKRKKLYSPLYLGEPTAECLLAQGKELSSLRQFSLGYVERTSIIDLWPA